MTVRPPDEPGSCRSRSHTVRSMKTGRARTLRDNWSWPQVCSSIVQQLNERLRSFGGWLAASNALGLAAAKPSVLSAAYWFGGESGLGGL